MRRRFRGRRKVRLGERGNATCLFLRPERHSGRRRFVQLLILQDVRRENQLGAVEAFVRVPQDLQFLRDFGALTPEPIGTFRYEGSRMFERDFVAYGVRIRLGVDCRAMLDAFHLDPARMHLPFSWRAVEDREPDAPVSIRYDVRSGVPGGLPRTVCMPYRRLWRKHARCRMQGARWRHTLIRSIRIPIGQ